MQHVLEFFVSSKREPYRCGVESKQKDSISNNEAVVGGNLAQLRSAKSVGNAGSSLYCETCSHRDLKRREKRPKHVNEQVAEVVLTVTAVENHDLYHITKPKVDTHDDHL